MKSRKKKILLAALAIFLGLPAVLIVGANAYFYAADRTNGSILSSGLTRRYLLYVPRSYDRTKPTPLVVSFHPGATWPAVVRNISRMNDVADQHGFIVVYPEGTGAFLGGMGPGPQIWPGENELPRDVKFVSELLDKLQSDYNIDPNRVYANGMSNGGAMAFSLGCELHDRVAAVGAVAPALPPVPGKDRCGDSKPIPTVAFHGTADKLAPYSGGKSPVAPWPFPNIPVWIGRVAQMNQCKPEPAETRVASGVRRLAYTNCAENADVILYAIEGGGHAWPGGEHWAEWITGRTSDEINASQVMWKFFTQHPRFTASSALQ